MFKKKTLMSALALTAIVSFNPAAALNPNQVQQAKAQIKSYQQQQNFSAAEQLINSLIKNSPDQVINYVYLAYNQYYAKQPQRAKQTLDTMIATKDMSKAADSTEKAVANLYKAIANQPAQSSSSTAPVQKASTPKQRVKKASQPKQPSDIGFGVTLESGFDSNHNSYPNANTPADLQALVDANELATDAEKQTALYSLLTLELNAQSKSIALGSQNLVLAHDVKADIEGRLVPNVEILVEPALEYIFTPEVKTGGRFFTGHSYPITLNYAASAAGSTLGFEISPTFELANDHSIGYQFAMTSDPSAVEGESNELTANDSFFYQFDKDFSGSFVTNVFAEVRFTLEKQAFNKYQFELNSMIKPNDRFSFNPGYEFSLTQFAYVPPAVQQNDVNHLIKAELGYQLNENFELGLKLNQAIQASTFNVASLNKTIIAFQIGWAN